MVLEMVGGRKNIDLGTSKIYFPDWLHDHVNNCGEKLEIGEEMTNQEEEMARKMILVSLWCIQTIPSDRPSMTKVVEIPPKPTLSFPTE
ncbi:hypothetical protein L484_008684 [Morus notabilis]|uniref:Uncharacterized protein n=1 Tax=Morus notabilis TaxID=981085 RepID=W9R8S1_9ROSA|nr:hypothetical protein L484_008684 [Morus notabilis]